MKVFVYYDMDHGDLEVFASMKEAKAHADECWPDSVDEEWEDCGDSINRAEYQSIHTKNVRLINMEKPIRPKDIPDKKLEAIPDVVIKIFNKLIAQHCTNGCSVVRQDDVVDELVEEGFNRTEIYENNWLDVESIYEKAGWIVNYDTPGYNENYAATFEFKKKTTRCGW